MYSRDSGSSKRLLEDYPSDEETTPDYWRRLAGFNLASSSDGYDYGDQPEGGQSSHWHPGHTAGPIETRDTSQNLARISRFLQEDGDKDLTSHPQLGDIYTSFEEIIFPVPTAYENLSREKQIDELIVNIINNKGSSHTNHNIRVFMRRNKLSSDEYQKYVENNPKFINLSPNKEKIRVRTSLKDTYTQR